MSESQSLFARSAKPLFLPDATRGTIKTLPPHTYKDTGMQALMTNSFHLSHKPGADVVKSMGGLKAFMGWDGVIATDSGGFQIYSLIRENQRNGSFSKKGFTFRGWEKRGSVLLSPEKSIQTQLKLGSDALFTLDVCTHPTEDDDKQRESVDLTLHWAKRCKEEFVKRTDRIAESERPKLFAVVQGGESVDLRKRCAEGLLEIGFDGFGFGGWPISESGGLVEMVEVVSELIPDDFPLHGLGIGKPENIMAAYRAGYNSFDSVLPTRDARRGRLFVSAFGDEGAPLPEKPYHYLYIMDEKFKRADDPIDPSCPCATCTNYPRSYVHHLLNIDEPAGQNLATLHNLTFFQRLMTAMYNDRIGESRLG